MVALQPRRSLAWLLVLGFLALIAAAPSHPAWAQSENLSLEVTVEAGSETPYVGEMILVTLTGTYDAYIALESFEDFRLRNFTWIQLGRDIWSKRRVRGQDIPSVERKIALYAQKSGQQTIGPFRHHLTLVAPGGERRVVDVLSNSVTLDIQPKPKTAAGWWLPAKEITLDDHWDMDPANLENGATVTRTVTIQAIGQTADALPPPPKMRAPWLISFIAPEQRSTELTRDGPIGTVQWQWRMRPSRAEPGNLAAFHIPWFDTSDRQMREIVIPSQRIAYAAIVEPNAETDRNVHWGMWAALAFGLGLPVALVLPGRRLMTAGEVAIRIRRSLPSRDFIAMRLAERRGDPVRFRHHAMRILKAESDLSDAECERRLAPLDAVLYGRGAGRPADLTSIRRALFGRLWFRS
ncbi:MAG: hypothetical protein VYD57_14625 [Pseudomonadota bacterium]|nr:hypothetical protein [Pseudomonadota bacterium]